MAELATVTAAPAPAAAEMPAKPKLKRSDKRAANKGTKPAKGGSGKPAPAAAKNGAKGGKAPSKAGAKSKPAAPAPAKLKEVKALGGVCGFVPGTGAHEGRYGRVSILGHSLSSVLRALARHGYTAREFIDLCQRTKGLEGIKEGQIRDKMGARSANGEAAKLARSEMEKLMGGKPGACTPAAK